MSQDSNKFFNLLKIVKGVFGTSSPEIASNEPVVEDELQVSLDSILEPEQNIRYVHEGIKDAITEATSQFCRLYIAPLNSMDSKQKYLLSNVTLYVVNNEYKLMTELERLNLNFRNQLFKKIIIEAPGAKGLFQFETDFTVRLAEDEGMIDEIYTEVKVSWSYGFANIKVVFNGDYIEQLAAPTLTQAPVQKPVLEPVQAPVKTQVLEPVQTSVQTPVQTPVPAAVSQPTTIIIQKQEPTTGVLSPTANHSYVGFLDDTPLGVVPLVVVKYKYFGQTQENSVMINSDMLPFTIGRNHQFQNQNSAGLSLFEPSNINLAKLVSKLHIVISKFDQKDKMVFIDNLAFTKNGCFVNGKAQAEKIIAPIKANKFEMILGGSTFVEGTVLITIGAI